MTKAIELDPNNALAYSNRGASKNRLEDYYGAIADCTRAIELDPNFAGAYLDRAYSKGKLKDYVGSVDDLTKAIELDPNYAIAYNNIAWYTHLSGNSKKALSFCKKGIEIDPNLAILYITSGEIKLGINNNSEIEKGLGLNDKLGACADWRKVKYLLDAEEFHKKMAVDYLLKYCN